jgi:septum site-determining protein MinC
MAIATKTNNTIRFRGRSFLALVLAPEHPLEAWFEEFDILRERSPSFFIGRAIVLDVKGLNLERDSLQALVTDLFNRGVRVMGVEGAKSSALGLGMPPAMSGGRLVDDIPGPVDEPAVKNNVTPIRASMPVPAIAAAASLLIDHPVRSGTSIVFPEGDVTILGSVSSGAEIVAGGSVHVYGALRGRVLAGSAGNAKARIFTQRFEAELVAIDGLYQTADELKAELWGLPVQVWLADDAMMMAKLD